ncbi:MAG: hypothetical protein DRJ56_04880 [Thermoprotei archaeon]|nr:MAG: hypothetical protein DRJ56_04880 [Thermoprotei archaeon]
MAGLLGAGKTTFISTMCSDGVFISTDRRVASPVERRIKERTTVAFDYGCTRWNEIKLVFYGTPGQRRFQFAVEFALRGGHLACCVFDVSEPDILHALMRYPKATAHRVLVGSKVDLGFRVIKHEVEEVARRLGAKHVFYASH